MSTDAPNDPATARFRRGAGSRVGPPGPPPSAVAPQVGAAVPTPIEGRLFAPPGDRPISVGDLPAGVTAPDPGNSWIHGSLFPQDDVREAERTRYDEPQPDGDWLPIDSDPGRTSGIVSIAVGAVVGLAGLFVGFYAVGQSRRVGLVGLLGLIGIAVSIVNMVVVVAVGISFARYEISLAQQCAVVGPGQYIDDSGHQVTCS